jgi:RND superfamily putative drug exporter
MTDEPAPRHQGRRSRRARLGHRRTALARLGRWLAQRPRLVLAGWAVLIVASFAAATGALGVQSLFDRLHSGEPTVAGENRDGRDLLAGSGARADSTVMILVRDVDVAAPATARATTALVRAVEAVPGVAQVDNPFTVPGGPSSDQAEPFLRDGSLASRGFVTMVTYEPDLSEAAHSRTEAAVLDEFDRLDAALGGRSIVGGVPQLIDAITSQVEKDLRTGEGVALPLSFVAMVVVFGGFIAAGLPIVGAIASIGGALASLLAFSTVIDLDATVVNVVTVLGLGLCIDYGLLTVSRFREELRALAQGKPAAEISRAEVVAATERTLDYAGRTIVFSGLTVAISLAGLLVFEASILRAIGAAGVSVVLVAMAVALTLVPALCAVSARRLLRRGTEVAPEEGVFSRLARWVHRFPVPIVVAVLAVLMVGAAPVLHTKLTSSGQQLLPRDAPQRVLFDTLRTSYPQLSAPQVTVVTWAPLPLVAQWAAQAAQLPGVQRIEPLAPLENGVVAVRLHTGDGGQGEASRALVARLRTERPPFPAFVVGQASGLQDFTDSLVARAPIAGVLVILATFVLLFLMTGSAVLPVKALLLNVVSLGASLGVLVWVFQEGHLEGLLRFDSVGALESTIPALVVAFAFGLSMDYEVFLLARIVELHERGATNEDAVIVGLQRSGRIITSAALLVVIVFSGFVAGQLLVIKETGVGLAVAVLVDATLVRMLLVPATMTLLGDWNWWAPTRLRTWHERYGIAG